MKNGWIKYFKDGTKEFGYDDIVAAGAASWSKGRLDGLVVVTLHHDNIVIAINGDGEFWQSDTMEVDMFSTTPQIVKRTLYKQIHSADLSFSEKAGRVEFSHVPISGGFLIDYDDVGKWFVLEMDCQFKTISWRIENNEPVYR